MSSKLSDILKVFAWNNTHQSAVSTPGQTDQFGGTSGLSVTKQKSNLKPRVIKLNFRDICEIDEVDPMYHEVNEISLNHNHLKSLDGIRQFKNLRSLQLNFNRLNSWDELLKIRNPGALQELTIKGNPNLDIPASSFCEMQN